MTNNCVKNFAKVGKLLICILYTMLLLSPFSLLHARVCVSSGCGCSDWDGSCKHYYHWEAANRPIWYDMETKPNPGITDASIESQCNTLCKKVAPVGKRTKCYSTCK